VWYAFEFNKPMARVDSIKCIKRSRWVFCFARNTYIILLLYCYNTIPPPTGHSPAKNKIFDWNISIIYIHSVVWLGLRFALFRYMMYIYIYIYFNRLHYCNNNNNNNNNWLSQISIEFSAVILHDYQVFLN